MDSFYDSPGPLVRGSDPAVQLAEALRLLLAELRSRPIDREVAIGNAREALHEWDNR